MLSFGALMNYWIIKGTQRNGRNDFASMFAPGRIDNWQTRRLPKDLTSGDRVFMWESSPGLRLVALAEVVNPSLNEIDGNHFYSIQYLTALLQQKPTLTALRTIPALSDASFLKAGPAVSVLSLRTTEAIALFEVVAELNPDLVTIWLDIPRGQEGISDLDIPAFWFEGKEQLVTHLRRERNRSIVNAKKMSVLSETRYLDCEVCGFNFSKIYGDRGKEFCEVHHRTPISETWGEVSINLSDLAIVCSNCHRMLHVRPWLAVEALLEILMRSNR
jgi:hypothetical protein